MTDRAADADPADADPAAPTTAESATASPTATAEAGTEAAGTKAAGTKAAGTEATSTEATGTEATGSSGTGAALPAVLIPRPLHPTDRAWVVHAAGAADPRDVAAGVELLVQAGVRVRNDPSAGQSGGDLPGGYLAGTDTQRLASLLGALRHPDARAILHARGGWGTMRLLDALEPHAALLRDDPRWMVGYSDITALHLWANAHGVATLHGPLVAGLSRYQDSRTLEAIVATLRGARPADATLAVVHPPRPHDATVPATRQAPTIIEGRLVGGNLSLLASMIGTRWLPDLADRLLFVEEVAEPLYRLDRLFETLRVSGRARGLRAIVLGQFTRCGRADHPEEVDAALRVISARFGVPVVGGLPSGHGDPNLPLVLGADHRLRIDGAHARLELTTPWPDRTAPDSAPDSASGTATGDHTRGPARHGITLAGAASGRNEHADALSAEPPAPVTDPERGPDAQRADAHQPRSPALAHPATLRFAQRHRAARAVPATGALGVALDAVERGVASAVQVEVSVGGEITHRFAVGATATCGVQHVEAVGGGTLFDVASVTKAVCTAVLAWRLVERGRVTLASVVPEEISRSGATLGQLLSHRSGLPAWVRYYDEARRAADPGAAMARWLQDMPPAEERRGQEVYSDIGYMILGRWLEALTGLPLDVQFARWIAQPLGLRRAGFRRQAASGPDMYGAGLPEIGTPGSGTPGSGTPGPGTPGPGVAELGVAELGVADRLLADVPGPWATAGGGRGALAHQ